MPARRLLAWYDRHRRDLPWRGTREPWPVWVSEIMLQQTRVEVVRAFYARFLARFPTPVALAEASLEEALAVWSGLGYYRRVRQLRDAAARVVAAGALPQSAADWLRLPGVGAYTAAAIASICAGEVVAALDGNVARVVARRLALAADPGRAAARRRLASAATALLDPARPGDSNQALMDLGATVCTPRRPRCELCPLARDCRGRARGRAEAYPRPRRRPPPARARQVAALTRREDGSLLLVRRGDAEALLAGLWEPPTVTARGRRAAEAALARTYGGRWRLGAPQVRVRHGITTRAIVLEARPAEWTPGDATALAEGPEGRWWTPEQARALALTGLARKVLERWPAGD